MAYGLKYELLCTSRHNSYAYKLKLLFDEYIGADIDRDMPAVQPLLLKKDRAAVVRGTSLDFAIREEVDFEFDEFYTNNPKKIKGELYVDTTLLWTGYVLPQQYQAPYIPVPLSVRFTATDGLGLLKNEDFTLTGNNSQLAILIHCIDKIGLGLGYSIAINLFETTHNTTYSPLAQTFEDAEIYENDKCYTVIEKILQKYDAEITQFNGRWYITCSADKKSTRMLYTSAGVYEGTEAAQAVLDLGYPGAGIEVWPVGRLNRTLEPGAKSAILTHNYGRKESLLNNYAFARFAAGVFTDWTKIGTFNLFQRILEGESYAFLSGGNSAGTDQIYQSIDVTDPAGEDFVFEMLFAPIGKNTDGAISAINMTVRFAVSVLVGATLYYLTETGTWTTTATIISKTVLASISAPVWNVISILADGLPGSGTLTVALYRYAEEETPHTGDVFSGIAFSKPKVYFLVDGQLYASGVRTLATFNNSTEPGDLGTIALSAADGPSVENVTLLFEYITTLSSGAPTTLWYRLGSVTEYLFMVQLARTLASRNRSARQILKGTIRGTGLNFGSFIKHTYNSNREFEIAEGIWDLYEEKWDVTLLEMLAWSDESITFSDTEENSASSSQPAQDTPSGGVVVGNTAGNTALSFLEVVNPGTVDEYLRVKLPIGCDYGIGTYTDHDQYPPSIWDAMPVASATMKGGIKVGSGLAITDGVLSVSAGGGMVYPESGIALSTGSAWGSSIADNSANWNSAYGWGNHASAGYAPIASPVFTGTLTAGSIISIGPGDYGNFTSRKNANVGNNCWYESGVGWKSFGSAVDYGFAVLMSTAGHPQTNPYAIEVYVDTSISGANEALSWVNIFNIGKTGILYALGGDSGQWNTAYGWGNHAGLYEPANANIQSHISNSNQAHSDYLKNNADDSTTGNLTAAGFKTTNFTITESGGDLVIKYGATVIAKISSAGALLAKAGIGTYQPI